MTLSDTLAPAPADNADFADNLAAAHIAEVATFEALLQTLRDATAAHDAAVTAFGLVEARQMSGEFTSSHPDYIAADRAVDIASNVGIEAERALCAVEAPTPEHAIEKARLVAFANGGAVTLSSVEEISRAWTKARRRNLCSGGVFAKALSDYHARKAEWEAAGAKVWPGRGDGVDDAEWSRVNDLMHEAWSRMCEARAYVLSLPARTAQAVADKVVIYYDDYESAGSETLWLNANDVAAIDGDEPEDNMRRLLANVYLDAQRLQFGPEPTDDAELLRLSYEYEVLCRRCDVLHPKVDASVMMTAPIKDALIAEQGAVSDEAIVAICSAVAAEHGEDKLLDEVEAVHARMDALKDRACSLQATTLAGLRAKVVISVEWRQADVDTREVDSLLADLAAMTGVALPPAFGFDANEWIAAYQWLGGDAYRTEDGGLYRAFPPERSPESAALDTELLDPAKELAVTHSARRYNMPAPAWAIEARAEAFARVAAPISKGLAA